MLFDSPRINHFRPANFTSPPMKGRGVISNRVRVYSSFRFQNTISTIAARGIDVPSSIIISCS